MADTNGNRENNDAPPSDGSGDAQQRPGHTSPLITHLMQNKVETTLWLTRIFTVVCAIMFMLPIFGGNPYSFYQRTLLATAATSALRMHQRMPHVQLNMDFLRLLFTEDSCHYLMYCIIFLNSYPMTMSLIPCFLFALLHACSFTKTVLNLMGPTSLMFVRNMITKLEAQQVNILRFIASTEIFLMPATVILVFTGKSSFFLPFLYYRFLSLRYASRRNPYNRIIFSEFRQATEYLCSKPQCPQIVRNLSFKCISIICRLAPVATAQ
ncbi:transmembrane protein 33 [Plakobranchus ocellatus]|uniref:Transmembrane protein 33 n=1 Tax=Plakobranchus ocellatus TaxID=259542 RepID=A0AAV3YHC8_9GAST|nr:transmembrane protein 33 [Plakobranchus ocellatus]